MSSKPRRKSPSPLLHTSLHPSSLVSVPGMFYHEAEARQVQVCVQYRKQRQVWGKDLVSGGLKNLKTRPPTPRPFICYLEKNGAAQMQSSDMHPSWRYSLCLQECMLSLFRCAWLCDPTDRSLPASSVHGDSPGKNTGGGCYALLQGIFPTQVLNPHLFTSPALAGRFFFISATWEAHIYSLNIQY